MKVRCDLKLYIERLVDNTIYDIDGNIIPIKKRNMEQIFDVNPLIIAREHKLIAELYERNFCPQKALIKIVEATRTRDFEGAAIKAI